MISLEEYLDFRLAYYTRQEHPQERFGQAFCNRFNVTDSDLFNERDADKAARKIEEKYISYE